MLRVPPDDFLERHQGGRLVQASLIGMDEWIRLVNSLSELLREGNAIRQMMQVNGEEGILLEDFVTYQKSPAARCGLSPAGCV